MQSEFITIQLYKGYAVVKGEYLMYNHSEETISMHVGYPINGSVDNNELNAVVFDNLYQFQIKSNAEKLNTFLYNTHQEGTTYLSKNINSIDKWYVWKNTFAPKKITKIEVYFIVNTTDAYIRKGYDKGEKDGFCYVLESGRAWKGIIEKGRILIELKDGLTMENILGIMPKNIFKMKNKQLILDFQNLEPKVSDNIILNIENTPKIENFENFIKKKFEKLYTIIDETDIKNIKVDESWQMNKANNFKIDSSFNGLAVNFFLFLAIYGLPIFMIFIGLMVGVSMIWRKIKKS
jgi:hypothetical protein